jgi:hypothetical protein
VLESTVGDLHSTHPGARGRWRSWWRARINLHGLVFVLSGFVVLYAVYRIVILLPVVPYQPTYHAAEFVIDRIAESDFRGPGARPSWAEGHVEPGGAVIRQPLSRTLDGVLVLANDRAIRATSGQRMRIWFSSEDDAPVVSVAEMRCIPDSRLIAFWMVFAIGAFAVGLRLTTRAGEHLQRVYFAERIG